MEESRDDRTLWVGNLTASKITEEILYELFLQAGPIVGVKIPKDSEGRSKNFAFVEFTHSCSVPYAKNLMNNLQLYQRPLNLRFRNGSKHAEEEAKGMGGSFPMQSPHMQRSTSAPTYDRSNQRRHPDSQFSNQPTVFSGPIRGLNGVQVFSGGQSLNENQNFNSQGNNDSPRIQMSLQDQMAIPQVQNPYGSGLPQNRQGEMSRSSRPHFEIGMEVDSRSSSRGSSYRDSPGSLSGNADDFAQQRGWDTARQGAYLRGSSDRGHESHHGGERKHYRSYSEKSNQDRSFHSEGRMADDRYDRHHQNAHDRDRGRYGQSRGGDHHRARSHREDELFRRGDRSYNRMSKH